MRTHAVVKEQASHYTVSSMRVNCRRYLPGRGTDFTIHTFIQLGFVENLSINHIDFHSIKNDCYVYIRNPISIESIFLT